MKKLSFLLISISLLAFSCNKDDVTPLDEQETATSFNMTFDGVTYAEVEENSLSMINGSIAIAGVEGNEFLLTIIGVGADGTTTDICPNSECENICTVILDFGAVEGKEGLVSTSGTVKRTGKTLEVNVSGISLTTLETKTLTATIVVGMVLDI